MRQKYNTITLNPFCCSNPSVNDIAKTILIVLCPQILMLFATKSISSVILLVCSVFASCAAQALFAVLKKNFPLHIGEAVIQGILIGMFLPAGYPYFIAFAAILCILFFQKLIFGTSAQPWANITVVAVIIMYFLYPSAFPPILLAQEYFADIGASGRLFSENIVTLRSFDKYVTEFLNGSIFSGLGVSVPEGYVTLFWDSQSLIPAFRFNMLTLIASLVLTAYRAADSLVSYLFILVYAVAVRLFALYPYGGTVGSGDILLAFFTGGTLFSAFFILGRFGTAPLSIGGKCVYAVSGGIIMFLICGMGSPAISSVFVLLFLNILSPVIRYCEDVLYRLRLRALLCAAGIKGESDKGETGNG